MSEIVYAGVDKSTLVVAYCDGTPDVYLTWVAPTPIGQAGEPMNVEAHYARDNWVARPMGRRMSYAGFQVQARTFFRVLGY